MIRDFNPKETQAKVKTDVKLKNGEIFLNCDITSSMFGDKDNIISFWFADKLRVYPIEAMEYCDIYIKKEDSYVR